MSNSDNEGEDNIDLFQEPADYYQPEAEAKFASHTLRSGKTLSLRLVGKNPLWGHLLWNAGRTVADYLEDHASKYIVGRNVLELGAGGGLPSLVSAIEGAKTITVTDYPDPDLIENLKYNITNCNLLPKDAKIEAIGHLWGSPVDTLKQLLPTNERDKGFQTLLLADLLFNHSEHQKLLQTVQRTLEHDSNAYVLVFFTPYRPWLLEKDLAFFDLAKNAGFRVKKILEKLMDKVMFEEDPGDETLRRTVFGFQMQWEAAE